MKKVFTAAVLVAAILIPGVGCKEKGPTEPIENFEYFLQGFVKIRNEAKPVSNYDMVIVDNKTQQSANGVTASSGWTEEFRWNSEPETLWVSGKMNFGTGYSVADDKNVVPTCVKHPESSKEGVFLCRFTIEVDRV